MSKYRARGHHERVSPIIDDEIMTKQDMKKDCDINFIVKHYKRTGQLLHAKEHPGQFTDVGSTEFHEAMNIIAEAKSSFAEQPATIRRRFDNDPTKYLAFVNDENNVSEMRDLGMLKPGYRTPEEIARSTTDQQKVDAPQESSDNVTASS
jgi:phage internal scaffolding protein